MAVARDFVQAPTFVPAGHTLVSVAAQRADEGHWRAGVMWEDICGGGTGTTYDLCVSDVVSVTGAPPLKTPTAEMEWFGATPFTVRARVDCSAVGFWDQKDQRVAEALQRSESFDIERTFWTGIAGGQPVVFPHLAATAEVTVTGTSGHTLQMETTVVTGGETPVEALALLENELSECLHGLGVIHMTPGMVTRLMQHGVLRVNGSRLETVNGHAVVAGIGYPGTGPSGTVPAGSEWMYATGPLFMYRGPIRLLRSDGSEIFDRAVNTVEAHAERTVLVGFGCCLLGIQVTIG